MIKTGPNTTNNNNASKTSSQSSKPINGSNSNRSGVDTNKGPTTEPKIDEVTSEDENLTNYEKYINKRNKTLVTNCPLILSINNNSSVGGLNTSTNRPNVNAPQVQVQFDSSKLNIETLERVCKGLNLNINGLSLKQIQTKLDKFWLNNYKPDGDTTLAKSLLKVKYDMGLESKDFDSVLDNEEEFKYFCQSSEIGQSDEDISEFFANDSTLNQRNKRALPTDGRQNSTRVKKRLHYYNIADDPEPQLDETYQDPITYLTNFSNNRNLYESEELDDAPEDDNNDSALDSKTPTNIDEKTPRGNSQVDNLREESNYMIEDDTQENELDELDKLDKLDNDNDGSQLNNTTDTSIIKNDKEVVNEEKHIQEQSKDQEETSKKEEIIEAEPEPIAETNEPVNLNPNPKELEQEENPTPKSENEETNEEPADSKSVIKSEPESEDNQPISSPTPVVKPKEQSPTLHDQSSPLPELTDPPSPSQQDATAQEDEENTKPDYNPPPAQDTDLDFTSDISDLTNHESP